jgi:hypothetical protein
MRVMAAARSNRDFCERLAARMIDIRRNDIRRNDDAVSAERRKISAMSAYASIYANLTRNLLPCGSAGAAGSTICEL